MVTMNLGGVVHVNKSRLILFFILLVVFVYLVANARRDSSTKQLSLRDLLETAVFAAKNGGKEVVALKDDLEVFIKGKTEEGLDDKVTAADYNSHCAMVATIKHFFPKVYLISEEHRSSWFCKTYSGKELDDQYEQIKGIDDDYVDLSDVNIWIDPLDATQEYTEKLYEYVTTMVCVAVKGRPVIGVIHNPFKDETTWGWVNQAVSPNLRKKPTEKSSLVRIITSRSHAGNVKVYLRRALGENIEVIGAGGAGYKALQVANGAAEAYVHVTNIKKWDLCAGNAILETLKGNITTLKGKRIDYADTESVVDDGIIATLSDEESIVKIKESLSRTLL